VSDLLKAIRLDQRIMRSLYKVFLLLLGIGVLVCVVTGSAVAAIVLVTLLTAPVGGTYFAVVEGSHLDHLYGTLPLKRAAAEAGIYVHTIMIVAANGLLATVLSWRIAILQHDTVSGGDLAATYSLALLAACVYIGLLYPLYLAVPFSKVYILSNIPLYVLGVFVMFVLRRTDWLKHLTGVINFYREHSAGASTLTIAAGLALLAISWTVAHTTASARGRWAAAVSRLPSVSISRFNR
jgi:ABC-2 family transporter protein